MNYLYHGDAIEIMDRLIRDDIKVNAVICDPPYGTTSCSWDAVIPFDEMWRCLKKITKPGAPIVLFGSEPFSSMLRASNIEWYKYDWKWIKPTGANVMQAKNAPLKNYEDIIVFSSYAIAPTATNQMPYYPQGLIPTEGKLTGGTKRRGDIHGERNTKKYVQEFTNYPKAILSFDSEQNYIHPTQKPVELLKKIIDFNNAEEDFTPNCYRDKSWEIIKLDFVELMIK